MSAERPHLPPRAWFVSLVGGAMLLLVGITLMAEQLGYRLPNAWIALVLLVPATAGIADGVRLALHRGWTDLHALVRALVGGLFAAIGLLLFLGIDTGVILPALIIVLGLAAIVRVLFR